MSFLDSFNGDVCGLMLKQEQTDAIYKLCLNLISKMKKFNVHLLNENNGLNAAQALDLSTKAICHKLSEYSSNFRRSRKFETN